jgi:hypothetical protein
VSERFDDELRRAARRLVTEELPPGMLDPGLIASPAESGVRARRALPGLATSGAAVALLIVTIAIGLAPGGPDPSASLVPTSAASLVTGPVFRSTTEIVAQVAALGYSCNDGQPLPTSGAGAGLAVRESAVCISPDDAGPLFVAIIVAESAAREVVWVAFKSDIVGDDTPAAREAVATTLARLVDRSMPEAGSSRAVGAFILARLPLLEPGAPPAADDLGGIDVSIDRHETGTYIVSVEAPEPG